MNKKNKLSDFFNDIIKSFVVVEEETEGPSNNDEKKQKKSSASLLDDNGDVKAAVQASILSKAADVRALTEAMRSADSITSIVSESDSNSSTTDTDTTAGITEKAQELKLIQLLSSKKIEEPNPEFDAIVQKVYPGALTNHDLITKTTSKLESKGFTTSNTLLATSLCCDELARQLEMEFGSIFGKNFNLGGLAGFPFAGNTGFGAMSAHIPDAGCCLLVYGPHVGITADGTVGKVERAGIRKADSCCGSAIAASNYVQGITSGTIGISMNVQSFTDFQQGVVQELILPHGKALEDAPNRMEQLPRSLYESQDLLMLEIVKKGSAGIRSGGLVMLGGIQINTGPATLDYFLPMRFDYLDEEGNLVESMELD